MSIPLDHHFLPQFLLQAWCGADAKLTAYTRPYDKVVTRRYSPAEVGKQRGLYSAEHVPADKAQVLETAFMRKVDHEGANAFQAALARGPLSLSSEQKIQIAIFVLTLVVRHPEAVAMMRTQGKEGVVAELDRDPDEAEAAGVPKGQKLSEFVAARQPALIDNFGLRVLPRVATNATYLEALTKLHWYDVSFPETDADLLLGDRACLREGDVLNYCNLVLPLSPRRALFMCSDDAVIERLKVTNQNRLVKHLNKWSVARALDYVYGSSDRHLPLVQAYLRRKATQ